MKIRTKLILGSVLLLLLMLTMAAIGIANLKQMETNLSEVYKVRYNKVKVASALRGDVSDLSRSSASFLMAGTPEEEKQSRETIYTEYRSLESRIDQLESLRRSSGSGDSSSSLSDAIADAGHQYLKYIDQLVSLVDSEKIEEAKKLRVEEGLALHEDLYNKIDNYNKDNERQMNNAVNDSSLLSSSTIKYASILMIVVLLLGTGIMLWVLFSLNKGLRMLFSMVKHFDQTEKAPKVLPVDLLTEDEFGQVGRLFNQMAQAIEKSRESEMAYNKANEDRAWLTSNIANITTSIQSAKDLEEVSELFISELSRILEAAYGALYLREQTEDGECMVLKGTYANKLGKEAISKVHFKLGQGLIGQAALDNQALFLTDIQDSDLVIQTAGGEIHPAAIMVQPVEVEKDVYCVYEVALLKKPVSREIQLIKELAEPLGVTLSSIRARIRVEELLRVSQSLTEELQAQSEELLSQQEELRASNEKLEEQTKQLKHSEELLQKQQEELEQSNSELKLKTKQLEKHVQEVEDINRKLVEVKKELEKKAMDLAMASKYKSEFLANMSHELRTPLNSLLILSQLLTENKEGNLTDKQVEYAETIHASGSDLLRLIDDVLDLSKLEAGKVKVHYEYVLLRDIIGGLQRTFEPLAKKFRLSFHIKIENNVPTVLYTDRMRVQQILKNLLSNAFKFTHTGGIYLHIYTSDKKDMDIAFAVEDTGIGISNDKLDLIFEAFQQADGTTSRKYGGTGLGLSISREFASLLGGTIDVKSAEGEGSTFTFHLPSKLDSSLHSSYKETAAASSGLEPASIPLEKREDSLKLPEENKESLKKIDIQETVLTGKKVLLADDDIRNVYALSNLLEKYGMEVHVAETGKQALEILEQAGPFDLILMDIMMPEMDGYETIRTIRAMSAFKNLPIIALTAKAMKEDKEKCIQAGASDYIMKPVNNEQLLSLIGVWMTDK